MSCTQGNIDLPKLSEPINTTENMAESNKVAMPKLYNIGTAKMQFQGRPIFFTRMQHKPQSQIIKPMDHLTAKCASSGNAANYINNRPSCYVLPAYLQLTEKQSSHSLAHKLIFSDESIETVIDKAIPFHTNEIRSVYPNYGNRCSLGQSNHFFFDLYYLSIGLKMQEFINLSSVFFSYKIAEVTKTRCHIQSQMIVSHVKSAYFLVPRVLSFFPSFFYDDKEQPSNKNDASDFSKNCSTEILQIGNFFASQVPEFADRREPPHVISELPKYTHVPISLNSPHFTKSYIEHLSNLQSTAFSAFLFNSQYVSVLSGSEGENNNTGVEEYITEYRNNLDSYFQTTASVPHISTIISTFSRAYSLLVCSPKPSFNRFPGYLIYTLSYIYDKSTGEILNLMNNNYDLVSNDIAQTILNAINKINEVSPQWNFYLTARNVIFSSKHILKYDHSGSKDSINILNNLHKSKFTLKIGESESQVIQFLRAFIEAVYPNSAFKRFFKLFQAINEELLIIRPFAAALLMIPTFVKLFRELEIEFNSRMNDELVLHGKDRFIFKVSEKIAGVCESIYDSFIISDAPFSMRMFLDYAIVVRTAKKEVLPQKLTFTNVSGFKLMVEIDTFSAILTSYLVSADFRALYRLYKVHKKNDNMNYHEEVAQMIQGRNIIAIQKLDDNQYTFQKIIPIRMPQLSTSYTFLFDPMSAENHQNLKNNEISSQTISESDAAGDSREHESDHESNELNTEKESS